MDEVDESAAGSLNFFGPGKAYCAHVRGAAGPVEWLTFPAPDDDTHQFRVDVSFLLSNYRCIFGAGCPGLLDRPPRDDLGCCGHGAEFVDDEDFDHVAAMVDELTEEDADNIAHIRKRGWFHAKGRRPFKTQILGGRCIFANRSDGPLGKPGCAFHHLAARTGRHPADTKPDICWRVPLNFSEEDAIEPNGRDTTIVAPFTGEAWGGDIHWWCTDTADAFIAHDPVYVTFEHELRKGMGDAAYEQLVELLDEIPEPRWPSPGQRVPKALPLIS